MEEITPLAAAVLGGIVGLLLGIWLARPRDDSAQQRPPSHGSHPDDHLVREALQRLEARTNELERSRASAYASLETQIEALSGATGALRERATSLVTALRGARVRGRWGELTLRNVVEVSGMSQHCDFLEQATTVDGTRPDLTVRLPGGRFVAVDAKAPLDAYLDASYATAEKDRRQALDRHVAALRGHVRALASRDYAAALPGDVDLVVLFLPGEPFLAAALERDPDLQVEALRSRVVLATPATLVALLRTMAITWQQNEVNENAREIAAAARLLYDRVRLFGDRLDGVGRGLQQALTSYNRAVGSFDSRVMPAGRKLSALRLTDRAEATLAAPGPIDGTPRTPADSSQRP